jgi:outer membrane protein assembly factor BamB
MNVTIKTILVSVALLGFGAPARAGYWSTVGGNSAHNGLSDEFGPIARQVLWEAQTLPSTIAMQVYTSGDKLATMRYDFGTMTGTLVCHSVYTGETLWTRLYRPDGKFLPFGFLNNRIYVRNFRESGHDTIFCVDADNGDILWQSRWTGPLGIIWCGCFADNGDLITPCAERGIARLNYQTGDTVWTNNRPIPNTGAEGIALLDTIVYAWEGLGINRPKYLIAIDANTGVTLHRSAELPGDGDQEIPFVVGPGHAVYCQRDGGLFYAFKLADSGFSQVWTRSDLSTATYSNYGVGPDQTLYVPSGRRIYRLNPADGVTIDSSPVLASTAINARISIDHGGSIYACVTTGTGEGHFWALTPDLQELWHDDVSYAYYSGPALTSPNLMIVSGPGTLLRAYQGPMGLESGKPARATDLNLSVGPNPFRATTSIRWITHAPGPTQVSIFDALGRRVRALVISRSPLATRHCVVWDGRDDRGNVTRPGAYFCRVNSAGVEQTVSILRITP